MSALVLTLRSRPAQRVDLGPLTTASLAGRSLSDIAGLALPSGNRALKLGEVFEVAGTPGGEIEIRNSCDQLDRVGAGLTEGRLTVRGDAGAYLGAKLAGGTIVVNGSTGAWTGSGMTSGLIQVTGNAGDFLGGAVPGDHQGMKGGTVVVGGNAGARAGDRMRRGALLIEGNAGDYVASRMVAGTIAVWGTVGAFPGLAMRRGTLLLRQAPTELLPTFNDCGQYPLNFLTLLARSWRGLPGKFATLPDGGYQVRRFMGDLANGGRGEVLVWAKG
ncbi:MAG TPA: formylmethanofuran dehydrogenase subunit C [Gemmatimonadales bacterium]|nr:formylmethanofuran dehydrogenase subunit C [Gemmatimonadales bacterium]